MRDIEIAIEYLEKEDIRIAVVKDGKLIFKSNDKGIRPIYRLARQMTEVMRAASIADKVIGRGAAILCKYMGIKEIHGQLMSESAKELLKKSKIPYTYKNYCQHIENMDRTDLCPIEKLSMDIDDGDVLLERIGEFISTLS